MSKKFYLLILLLLYSLHSLAQPCTGFTATAETFESRCASTGQIVIKAFNGSGNYNYAVNGPVSTPYTSSDTINGLPPGSYQVFVKDIVNDCFFTISAVIVDGSYQDPRFELSKTDVTCFNGQNGTISVNNVQFGRTPFSYTIVAPSTFGIGTTSDSGLFTNLVPGNYFIQQRDSCGGIQTRNISILNYDWFIDFSSVTRQNCDSADVIINLKDIYGNVSTSGSTFDGYIYGVITPAGDTLSFTNGSFRIKLGNLRQLQLFAKDLCGNIKPVNWFDTQKPIVATAVLELNKTCNNFSAAITGQQNLANPEYCLYDSLDVLISCNTTGQFDSLQYGSYCIRIRDLCYDTTINRCFTALKPVPSVNANVTVNYGDDCNIVTVSIGGQTNLFNPTFCLYDSLDVLISCNNTGTFTGVGIGRYCMKITGSICNDTTLIRCFTVVPLELGPGTGPEFSNYNCSTFTGRITGTAGLGNATYCLYNDKNILLGCNKTGVFDSLAYGSYCITIEVSVLNGGCLDTIFPRCFTVDKPLPSVGNIKISKTCALFNAAVEDYQNLFNPDFCLYKDSVLLACNKTGIFNNLAYGTYCIAVKDSCTDSTLLNCITVEPDVLQIKSNAKPSCSLNQSRITVNIQTGTAPFTYKLYTPGDSLLAQINSTKKQVVFDSLPVLAPGERYKIIVTDSCKNTDTISVEPIVSFLTKSISQVRNCPGGSFTQGSSDVTLNLRSNLSKAVPVIISKNGSPVTINYSFSNTAQTIFTFKELEPGTYIFKSTVSNSCNLWVFDTVTVTGYQYPSLQNSILYRCDDNSFNVTAVTNGGIPPNYYEIIGSVPAFPSIITAPQTSPQFKIDNGAVYTVARLRVLDACGNASINDISLVPLINFTIDVQGGCIFKEVTMRVDSLPAAVYSWYRKLPSGDSIFLDSTASYYIPYITTADTGTYVCKIVLSNGCVTRHAYFNLTGFCQDILNDNNIKASARKLNSEVVIEWKTTNEDLIKEYFVERKKHTEQSFTQIKKQMPGYRNENYSIADKHPGRGLNYYRIRLVKQNGSISYSNVMPVNFRTDEEKAFAYPNPAKEFINVQLNNKLPQELVLKLMDMNGRILLEQKTVLQPYQTYPLKRPGALKPGMYYLFIINSKTQEQEVLKVVFH